MPKKNRNGQRKQEHEPYPSSPALIDMAGLSPEAEADARSLGESPPLFTFDGDVDHGGGGTARYYGVDEGGGVAYGAEEAAGTPVDRPSPLSLSPLPPPLPPGEGGEGGVDHGEEHAVGHTRTPVLAAEPTVTDTITRTVNTAHKYLSSIPAIPTPPRITRPVSIGSFLPSLTPPSSGSSPASRQLAYSPPQPPARAARGYSQSSSHGRSASSNYNYSPPILALDPSVPTDRKPRGHSGGAEEMARDLSLGGRRQMAYDNDDVFEFDDSVGRSPSAAGRSNVGVRYGEKAKEDEVVWAGWDETSSPGGRTRRLLILGYNSGLQIWDCTDLGAVQELLNLSSGWGRVVFVHVLPDPPTSAEDQLAAYRPLIGIIQEQEDTSSMSIYSLSTHRVIKEIEYENVVSFAANPHLIVISISTPPTLHVIASSNLSTLFTVPSASLVTYTPTNPTNPTSVLSTHLEVSYTSDAVPPRLPAPPVPVPVFALSQRLLAFASAPPAPDSPGARSRSRSGASQTLPSVAAALPGVNMSRDELGAAALKVGGSMLSGMRMLGGLAISAAKSRMAGPVPLVEEPRGGAQGGLTRMFSRSAPAGTTSYASSAVSSPRRGSVDVGAGAGEDPMAMSRTAAPVAAHQPAHTSHFVTVLDLKPLFEGMAPQPVTVAEFAVSKTQPTAGLQFTQDGSELIVSPRDGYSLRVLRLRLTPTTLLSQSMIDASAKDRGRQAEGSPALEFAAPLHVYELRRGRSVGVIESVKGNADGRWIAMGTRNRTVHIFATNPYGGRPDERSHMEGRVRNSTEPMPLSVDIGPLVRMKVAKPANMEQRSIAPLAFTFVKTSNTSLPSSLLPPPMPYQTPASAPLALPSSPAQRPLASPTSPRAQRPSNYQDILLFDPHLGQLSLRRIWVEKYVRDNAATSLTIGTSVPIVGGTSISLPSMSPLTRMGSSPPTPVPRTSTSALTESKPAELAGKESVVATWALRRGSGWKEIKNVVKRSSFTGSAPPERTARADWLAQAELSTFSRAPGVLPRTVYLSHQFSFHALGEDYHALIRRFQFDIPATPIEVRKEVEVSAYPSGQGESFLQGRSVPRDIRGGAPASFDGPLASAMSGGIEYSHASPPVLPMFPNGAPGSHKASSYRSPIPIRNMAAGLTEGVTAGLGQLRRGVGKVRSPPLAPSDPQGLDANIEFDDDDEDFAQARHEDVHVGSLGTTTSVSVGEAPVPATPPTVSDAPLVELEGEYEAFNGWDEQDREAVADAERFDELVVGIMDEEHAVAPAQPSSAVKVEGETKRKKGKKR